MTRRQECLRTTGTAGYKTLCVHQTELLLRFMNIKKLKNIKRKKQSESFGFPAAFSCLKLHFSQLDFSSCFFKRFTKFIFCAIINRVSAVGMNTVPYDRPKVLSTGKGRTAGKKSEKMRSYPHSGRCLISSRCAKRMRSTITASVSLVRRWFHERKQHK